MGDRLDWSDWPGGADGGAPPGPAGLAERVDRLLDFAVQAVGCSHAGVLFVHRGGRIETVAATDDDVARLDRIQVETGDGPDVALLQGRRTVLVDDTHADERWPVWAAAAGERGIRSMMGLRLATGDTMIGNLNLYSTSPGYFGDVEQQVAHLLAQCAADALGSARQVDRLWQAIDARHLVGQAQGILMERFDLTPDQAFDVLRRYSQHGNVKLNLVARELVDSRRLPE